MTRKTEKFMYLLKLRIRSTLTHQRVIIKAHGKQKANMKAEILSRSPTKNIQTAQRLLRLTETK